MYFVAYCNARGRVSKMDHIPPSDTIAEAVKRREVTGDVVIDNEGNIVWHGAVLKPRIIKRGSMVTAIEVVGVPNGRVVAISQYGTLCALINCEGVDDLTIKQAVESGRFDNAGWRPTSCRDF